MAVEITGEIIKSLTDSIIESTKVNKTISGNMAKVSKEVKARSEHEGTEEHKLWEGYITGTDYTERIDQAKARVEKAEDIVKSQSLWALAGGAVPVPFLDMAAVFTANTIMLSNLSDTFSKEFDEKISGPIVISLFNSLGSKWLSIGFVSSVVKIIPGAGSVLGYVSFPLFASAFTYAVGMVAIKHFETGGSVLTFKTTGVQKEFNRQFEKGFEAAAKLKEKKKED